MTFPFTHPDTGGICCSSRRGCCPRCEAKLVAENTGRSLRSGSRAEDFAPPDPYAAGLAKLRASDAQAAAAKTYQPTQRPTEMHLDANGIPDPYASALAAMKENRS